MAWGPPDLLAPRAHTHAPVKHRGLPEVVIGAARIGTKAAARHRLRARDVGTLQIARKRAASAHRVEGVRGASSVDLRLMHSVAQIVIDLGA